MHVNDTRVVIERMRIQSNARTEKCVCVQEEAEEGEAKATAGVVAAVAGRGGWWSGQWRWSRGGVRSHGVNFAPTFPAAAWALGRGARLCLPGIPFPCHRCRRRSLSFNLLPGFGLVFRLVRPIRPSSLIRETSL